MKQCCQHRCWGRRQVRLFVSFSVYLFNPIAWTASPSNLPKLQVFEPSPLLLNHSKVKFRTEELGVNLQSRYKITDPLPNSLTIVVRCISFTITSAVLQSKHPNKYLRIIVSGHYDIMRLFKARGLVLCVLIVQWLCQRVQQAPG